MFLHLGGDTLINLKQIIAIINAEYSLGANSTREFLKTAQEEGFVKQIDRNYASIVITDKTIYLSPISSLTLRKRAGFVEELEANQ